MNKHLATLTLTVAALACTPLAAGASAVPDKGPRAGHEVMVPAKASSSCGGRIYATPFKRSKAQKSNCFVFGSRDARHYYSWSVPDFSDAGGACMEGWGFDHDHPKGRWFSLGCGKAATAVVPWGNYIDYPRVRGQSLNVPGGTYVDWRG